jgi:hypothetical protein
MSPVPSPIPCGGSAFSLGCGAWLRNPKYHPSKIDYSRYSESADDPSRYFVARRGLYVHQQIRRAGECHQADQGDGQTGHGSEERADEAENENSY